MFSTEVLWSAIATSKKSGFECDIGAIKNYMSEIANTYLLIAYRLYEIKLYKSYEEKGYKNIFEACENELKIKKSTVYNLLRIVEIYGYDEKEKKITFQALSRRKKYSYAQLVEMLSMTSIQRANVTPETTVKEIREIKRSEKFQTSGKSDVTKKTPEAFQTSGKFIDITPKPFDDTVLSKSGKQVLKAFKSALDDYIAFLSEVSLLLSSSELSYSSLSPYFQDLNKNPKFSSLFGSLRLELKKLEEKEHIS